MSILQYKNDKYYWEFVKIYYRMLVGVIITFYSQEIKLKALLVFIVIFFYAVLVNIVKPYK